MVIYLRHPIHGTKVATAESEALYDCTNGWERYNLDTPDVVAPVEKVTRKYTLKMRKEIDHGISG